MFLRFFEWLDSLRAVEPDPEDLAFHRWLASLRPGDAVVCRMGKELVPELGAVVRRDGGALLVSFSGRTLRFVRGQLVGYRYRLEPAGVVHGARLGPK